MTRKTAVVICPGRGTYTKTELGYLGRYFPDKPLLARFDDTRTSLGQETLTALDGAPAYSVVRHTRGDNASGLIYGATLGDFRAIDREKVDVVAVTGNSMGWYSTLACGGALTAENGFAVVNTMGTLMQEALIGGQTLYPFVGEDWRNDPAQKAGLMAFFPAVDGQLLPQSPFDPQASPLSATVPVLVGATRDESTAMLCRSLILAERKIAQGQAPVYVYRVDWETPVLGGKLGSPHGIELPFVFDNIDTAEPLIGTGAERQALADAMSQTFAAFARTGNPATASIPDWPAYNLDNRATMVYGNQLDVLSDPDRARCNAWQTAQWVAPAEVLK